MRPVAQRNAVSYTAPGCESLPVIRAQDAEGKPLLVSAWELSADEIVEVLKSGQVWLIVQGERQPPVSLTAQYPFQETGET